MIYRTYEELVSRFGEPLFRSEVTIEMDETRRMCINAPYEVVVFKIPESDEVIVFGRPDEMAQSWLPNFGERFAIIELLKMRELENAPAIIGYVNPNDFDFRPLLELTQKKEHGIAGQKHGDTPYDSVSVAYGHNKAMNLVKNLITNG